MWLNFDFCFSFPLLQDAYQHHGAAQFLLAKTAFKWVCSQDAEVCGITAVEDYSEEGIAAHFPRLLSGCFLKKHAHLGSSLVDTC